MESSVSALTISILKALSILLVFWCVVVGTRDDGGSWRLGAGAEAERTIFFLFRFGWGLRSEAGVFFVRRDCTGDVEASGDAGRLLPIDVRLSDFWSSCPGPG